MTMDNKECPNIEIYELDEGSTNIKVQFEDDSVWLNRQQIAELFDRDVKTISKHVNNMFKEGELEKQATVANFATVQTEGNRQVERQVEYYNPPVSIRSSLLKNNLTHKIAAEQSGIIYTSDKGAIVTSDAVTGQDSLANVNRDPFNTEIIIKDQQTAGLGVDANIDARVFTEAGQKQIIKEQKELWKNAKIVGKITAASGLQAVATAGSFVQRKVKL